MYYGASYYPEHKNDAELKHDLELLKASGINTVRMGEFAWCRFEPSEGIFNFDWLDTVVEELGKAGIMTVICTPTACPPAWLVNKHPEILYTDNRGIQRPFGGRRHYCYNNEVYRRYSACIAEEIGRHYGDNPYVLGFQIDNEPAQEGTGRCCCPACVKKFQDWIKKEYNTIEIFNKRIGAIFWSIEYTDFSQITPPVNTIEPGAQRQIEAFYENPSVRLLFERFSSECQIEYQNIQRNALKKYTTLPVTTNATGLATNSIDYYKSNEALDVYAFDYYPGLRDAKVDSFPYAFGRGIKNGQHFWVLEFMSGGGHRLGGSGRLQPNPGALKQSVIHSFAHGADMMLHFQFRTFPFGAEQLNYAIVDMDGVPRRRYYEMKDTAETLKKLDFLSNAEFANNVAICVDYNTHWALRIKPVNDPEFKYLDYCGSLYRKLSEIGINADVISLEQDLDKYKLIMLPSALVMSKSKREKLKSYVANGGILVATFLTSVKNEDNVGYTETLPAGLTDLFGISVEEVEPVFDKNRSMVEIEINGKKYISLDGMWSELLNGNAEMLGIYKNSYKENCGVISKNSYGKGFAYYIGTDLKDEAMHVLLESICKEHGLFINPFNVSKEIEIIRRYIYGKNVYFIFNFSGESADVNFDGRMYDCLSGEQYTDVLRIEKNGFIIVSEKEVLNG